MAFSSTIQNAEQKNMQITIKTISITFLIGIINIGNDVFASEDSIIEKIHLQPPEPCISKSVDDISSLIAINPTGETREEIRDHIGAIVSTFLSSGSDYMSSKHIETIYIAVFYEKEPINEVGIYGYRFKKPIDSNLFEANSELNGKLFIFNNKLLMLLWHEDINKTGQCFAAMHDALTNHSH